MQNILSKVSSKITSKVSQIIQIRPKKEWKEQDLEYLNLVPKIIVKQQVPSCKECK